MSEYMPNSNKFKKEQAEKKKIEKVVKGTVRTKKKSELSKFGDMLIANDAKSVGSYLFVDVLIPSVKKALYDIVTDGFDMLLFGGDGKRHKKRSTADRVSYNRYYDDRNNRERTSERYSSRGYSFDDIVLDTRAEAEEVLNAMDGILDTYGMVSVADLNDLVGVTGQYTDNKYGWSSIRTAEVVRVRDGYMLKLPRATIID